MRLRMLTENMLLSFTQTVEAIVTVPQTLEVRTVWRFHCRAIHPNMLGISIRMVMRVKVITTMIFRERIEAR